MQFVASLVNKRQSRNFWRSPEKLARSGGSTARHDRPIVTMSALLVFCKLYRPSLHGIRSFTSRAPVAVFAAQLSKPSPLTASVNVIAFRSFALCRNGQATSIAAHGHQRRILDAYVGRILLLETKKRWFQHKWIMAHQKKNNPGRRYEDPWTMHSLYASTLTFLVFFCLIDVDWVIKTCMPESVVNVYVRSNKLWRKWWRDFLRVDAASINQVRAAEDAAAEADEEDDDETVVKDGKKKKTFRERKIIEYENRIRQFSTPDKVRS